MDNVSQNLLDLDDKKRIDDLKSKQIEELNFWLNIKENPWRGFNPDEWRNAHIHFKQYSLIYINRSIEDLKNKIVIEIGCGPAGIVPFLKNTTAIGVDPLIDEYKKLWDLSNDNVKYIKSEIESFNCSISADIVICWNVLDHVSDIELAIKKINNIIKTEG
ncbi:MAG: hypothetical protein A2W05_01170 [Candidatus Schekmanbacteria bacterium RBG_16_38_10]|uniref:Uncharacterized protein n=1 Tax=Candidatus Schekmanbacteria bacterium RBG_16_38_10 TaxID=1817879 RepID=A0A1F7RWQ6_9BACT|nr:MAG: hypothetical protein A2W05_01170 [Candidatus Schekmanbacteria bacterium RBG_16_38_10]